MSKNKDYIKGFKDGVNWALYFHFIQLKEIQLIHLKRKLRILNKNGRK